MTGRVINGEIVLDPPHTLPDGTQVTVELMVENTVEEPKPTLLSLMKLAGTITDMPPDFAEQHDHYIHGTPKR